jgi:oxygen-independent coproporphyrinogen-3 oxidase
MRQRAYFEAVCREIEANAAEFTDLTIQAVRLGGGIASCGGEGIAEVMRCARHHLAFAADAPVTMRTSLSNISGATMTWFKRAGITRYDLEMMSLCPQDFSRLNRQDSLADYETVCDYILRSYANRLLGLILAYGMAAEVSGRTLQNFRDTLIRATRSHTSHVRLLCYEGKNPASDEEKDEQLAQARELLGNAGFEEYLPLFFARDGETDSYFSARAAGIPELGFGLGAQTVMDGVVSTNTQSLVRYLANSADYTQITEQVAPLSPAGA